MSEQTPNTGEQGKKEEATVAKETKGKKKFLDRFVTFLIYGGWLLILFLGVAITIVVSIVFKCK